MNRSMLRAVFWVLTCTGLAMAQGEPAARPRPTRPAGPIVGNWHASGTRGAVVGGGRGGVGGGLSALGGGGNAVDAAVTTILAQSVTDANHFCSGGGVPFLVYDARRKVVEALAGQG